MRITKTGNVGIGTIGPTAKLHIVNPTSTGLTVTTQHVGDYGYGIISEVNRDFTKAIAVTNNASAGVQTFVVYGDGRVGIGADPDGDPTYKLLVCGTIRTKEVVVESSVWCDYKFEPSHKRMTWLEKKNFFDINKHLPEVETANEIEKNGLKLGKTLYGFAYNIEDNSLDIITLFETTEKLKDENAKLKTQNEELEKRISTLEIMIKK
ncbi:MAG: hypothetical protein HY841_15795 [Bacteroidetes bacterium]|nr:hypothetical protein [Bacteroidota bacterium]